MELKNTVLCSKLKTILSIKSKVDYFKLGFLAFIGKIFNFHLTRASFYDVNIDLRP